MRAAEQQVELDRACKGDREALGRLLDSYRPYIRFLVRALRRGRAPGRIDDSDLIQDALVEVQRFFPRFTGKTTAEFTSWLRPLVMRSASHTLRAHLGRGKRDVGREQPDEDLTGVPLEQSSPSEQAIHQEEAARVAGCLARLPDDMQQLILGRLVEKLSYADLAQRLGRSEGALRVLYTRALRRLRQEMHGE